MLRLKYNFLILLINIVKCLCSNYDYYTPINNNYYITNSESEKSIEYDDNDDYSTSPPINSVLHYNRRQEFAEDIKFFVFVNGKQSYLGNGTTSETITDIGCTKTDKFTFIIHGWREDSETEWVPLMIANFTKYRGGCIIFIDYGFHAGGSYIRLIQKFDSITYVIYSKIKSWQLSGLDLSNTHIFGFSYGARLAVAVGRKFGKQLINSIDTCDMAGPGFDYRYGRSDIREAAKNVQCIHTSRDKGTRFYTNCHQNWRMGNCGFSQPGADDPPYGSHGLCVYYYLLSFEHNFYAHKKPNICATRNPALKWPENFRMGYMETRQSEVHGELFVPVSDDFPFAIQYPEGKFDDEILLYSVIPIQAMENIRNFRNRPIIKKLLLKARRNLLNRSRNRFD